MVMEWTEESVIQFIDAYRKKEVMWDPKHPNYYNKNERHDAWEDIAAELNTTGEECRRKMTGLLSALRREKSKIRKSIMSRRGRDEVYKSSWFAFERLQFLWEKHKQKQALSAVPSENIEESQTDAVEGDDVLPPSPSIATSSGRKKRRLDYLRPAANSFDFFSSSASTPKAKEEDECFVFGSFIGKKLQKYSPGTQSAVQQAIVAILFDADKGCYDQTLSTQHPQYPPYPTSESPTPSQYSDDSSSAPNAKILSACDVTPPTAFSGAQVRLSGRDIEGGAPRSNPNEMFPLEKCQKNIKTDFHDSNHHQFTAGDNEMKEISNIKQEPEEANFVVSPTSLCETSMLIPEENISVPAVKRNKVDAVTKEHREITCEGHDQLKGAKTTDFKAKKTVESKEDIFAKYIASELRQTRNTKIYNETKCKLLLALMEGINKQSEVDTSLR